MFNKRIHEIRWIELFFDIILVIGISQIVTQLAYAMNLRTFIVELIIVAGFLFDIWIKVMLFENKINIVKDESKIKDSFLLRVYPTIIYIIFSFAIVLLYLFGHSFVDNIFLILIVMIIIRLLMTLLMEQKLFLTIGLILSILIYLIFGTTTTIFYLAIYQIVLFFETYRNFYKIELDTILIPKNERQIFYLAEGKFNLIHILERLGILMIVFLAEYFIAVLHTDENEFSFFIFVILMLYPYLFFLDFYGKVEYFKDQVYIDLKTIKRIFYLLFLYYVSISCVEVFVHTLNASNQAIIFLILAEVLYFSANILLERKANYKIDELKRFIYYSHNIVLLICAVLVTVEFGLRYHNYKIMLTIIVLIHVIDVFLTRNTVKKG